VLAALAPAGSASSSEPGLEPDLTLREKPSSGSGVGSLKPGRTHRRQVDAGDRAGQRGFRGADPAGDALAAMREGRGPAGSVGSIVRTTPFSRIKRGNFSRALSSDEKMTTFVILLCSS